MLKSEKILLIKLLPVFICGAFAYGMVEIAARGFTHISMGLLGGAAMCLIHIMNEGRRSPLKMFGALTVSALFITACELITGEIVNVKMGLNIWDYSMMPMNYDGQICLPFTLLWFALSAVGVILDDLIRIWILYEERELFGVRSRERTAA